MASSLISNPPPWPDGARCAVSFTFDMDAESLLHLYHRQDAPRLLGASSALRYGPRIAVPRLVEIARRYGMKLTAYIPGWCVEAYPNAIAALLEEGHEIGHHGWLHEKPNTLDENGEERVLLAGIEAITKATGAPPKGYRAPAYAISPRTVELLIEHGFSYDASLMGDDVPYLLENDVGKLLELPSDYALDDWPQYVNMKEFGFLMQIRSPERALEVFRAEFDAAWRHGGLWISVFHPFVSGRLARADALVELIEHMQTQGGVWFATMAEIAAYIRGLIDQGIWAPRCETLPHVTAPVEHLANPRHG